MKNKLIELVDGLREELTPNAYIKISNAVHSLPDDQPDVLPFQWPIPDGMEVVTRDGRKVEQLVMFKNVDYKTYYPFMGVCDKKIVSWDKDGTKQGASEYDLFLRRKEKKVWVVASKYDILNIAGIYASKDECIKLIGGSIDFEIYEATLKPVV